MSPRTSPSRDWAAGLPTEILAAILPYLPSFADHLRFAAVCAPWRSAAKQAPRRHPAALSPWLLLAPRANPGDGRSPLRFLRPSDGRLLAVSLPHLCQTKCVGISPDGWLVLVELRAQRLHALNPVTGALLRLPSAAAVPRGTPKVIHKVAMSSPYAPNNSGSVAAAGGGRDSAMFAAILTCRRVFKKVVALARAGDRRWTLLDLGCLAEVFDVTYLQGKFYVLGNLKEVVGLHTVSYYAAVGVIDCGAAGDPLSAAKVTVVPLDYEDPDLSPNHRLVGSPSGGVLLVDTLPHTRRVKVFWVDLDVMSDVGGSGTEGLRVVELTDLGDGALLVGDPCSLSVSTREVPQLRRNCVYWIRNVGSSNMRVLDLEDEMEDENRTFHSRIMAAWFSPSVF